MDGCDTPPNFAEKTFADDSQTSKSAKDFSLERFPAIPYIVIVNAHAHVPQCAFLSVDLAIYRSV